MTTVVCMIFEMISCVPFKRSQLCHPSLFSVTFHAICSSVPQSVAHTGPLTLQPSSLRRRHRVGLHLRQERPHGHLTFSFLMSYHIKKNKTKKTFKPAFITSKEEKTVTQISSLLLCLYQH